MTFLRIFTLGFVYLTFLSTASSQKKTLFQHFVDYGNEIPTIKIDTDFKNLIKQKQKEEYQEASIEFTLNNELVSLPIKVRARGNMRKKVCQLPPLKIDLSKGQLDSLGFKKSQDNLKLVLPCKDNGGFHERLKMEHFIYELYSVVEPYHMKTKLVKFEFWWEGKLKEELVGFLVEDEDHYAKRLNAKMVTTGNIRSAGFNRSCFVKLCFFQYMIANTDWSVNNRHNLEIAKVPEYKRVIPIAYDFDYAGLINQPYAVPHESLPIENVTERHFYKTEVKENEAIAVANFYKDNKDALLAKCDNALYLKEKTRKQMKKFIEGFYKKLNSEKSIKRTFASK